MTGFQRALDVLMTDQDKSPVAITGRQVILLPQSRNVFFEQQHPFTVEQVPDCFVCYVKLIKVCEIA